MPHFLPFWYYPSLMPRFASGNVIIIIVITIIYIFQLVPNFRSIFVFVYRNLFILLNCDSVSVLAIAKVQFCLNSTSSSACNYLLSCVPTSSALSVLFLDTVFHLLLATCKSKYVYSIKKNIIKSEAKLTSIITSWSQMRNFGNGTRGLIWSTSRLCVHSFFCVKNHKTLNLI